VKDPAIDKARKTVNKFVNTMHENAEVPATFIVTCLLDIPDHYTSHDFTHIVVFYFTKVYTLNA
jgi:hypothetical protein